MALTPTCTSAKGTAHSQFQTRHVQLFFQCPAGCQHRSVCRGCTRAGWLWVPPPPAPGCRSLGSCCRYHPPQQLLHVLRITPVPRGIPPPLLAFWERLYNSQLRPLALFSKLTEGLSGSKSTVQLFGSRFQEMNTFVDPRLSGQTAKIMNTFTVENKIKEQKYTQQGSGLLM